MSLKSIISSAVTHHLTSEQTLLRQRKKYERQRLKTGEGHVVHYFHQVDDPYGHLVLQVLPAFCQSYEVALEVHLVNPPPAWAAPDPDLMQDYARRDAVLLSSVVGLEFVDPGNQPAAQQINRASAELFELLKNNEFAAGAQEVSSQMWLGQLVGLDTLPAELEQACARNDEIRESLGHYLGATFYYAGEWYWGIDRLAHLERRLQTLGLAVAQPASQQSSQKLSTIVHLPTTPTQTGDSGGVPLHFFLSFRSPYTAIVIQRVKALADAYQADLQLRFVMPMVTRGVPAPRMKKLYITRDTAREARFYGAPFGRICDPLGKPVERGFSLLPWSVSAGRGYEFCLAFLQGVFAQGIDAGSNSGMARIVTSAGLDWSAAKDIMGNDDWREEANANAAELNALGLWGVPSFRVADVAVWGQDRLWAIERELQRLSQS